MKELTIEQKAQRYNEALEYAKSALDCLGDDYICNHLTKDDIRDMYAKLFPELKEENEDERIRKEILKHFVEKRDMVPTKAVLDEWIAWLEKQGEHPAKNIIKTWKDMRLEVYQQASGNRHEPNCSDDTTKMFSLNDIDEIVEKISEQKPYGQRKECSDCQFNYAGECKGSCQMKRDKLKSADKVEPKFNVMKDCQYEYK